MNEILNALTNRLIALGNNQATAPRQAAIMLRGWWKFTDYDSQETGARQADAWLDKQVVKLLDAGLNAHYRDGQPYPEVGPAAEGDDDYPH
jgi:hypothetical protein